MVLKLSNKVARRLWLDRQLLSSTPVGKLDLMATIRQLGYVQLDTIRAVERAHHHILWSRNQNYRPRMLDRLLAKDRGVFEHFTHDASVLPTEFYPNWTRQFRRFADYYERTNHQRSLMPADEQAEIKARIAAEGPLCTHAFDTKIDGKKEMWARPPHKQALDYMWYCGDLSTSHRDGFTKYYDLTERVIPEELRRAERPDHEQVDWLNRGALDRLGFATVGEIKRFWDAVDTGEVKDWLAGSGAVQPVEVQGHDGRWSEAYAPPDIEDQIAQLPTPSSRLRILNPFDPAVRDRARLHRLFGMDFRIEIFVPAEKRRWGYYVFPLLEGDRFVGRIDAKADRKTSHLEVLQFWPEGRAKWGSARRAKLEAELARLARFAELEAVRWREQPDV